MSDGYLTSNADYDVTVEIIDRIKKGGSKCSTARAAGVSRPTINRILERADLYQEREQSEPEQTS